MSYNRMIACAIALAGLTACTSWHVVELTPAQFPAQRPRDVRVVRNDSSQVSLHESVVRSDTLIGRMGGSLAQGDTGQEVRIPLDAVRSVAVRRFSPGKTILLYLVLTVPATIIYLSSHGGTLY